jgi:hypothetical protein
VRAIHAHSAPAGSAASGREPAESHAQSSPAASQQHPERQSRKRPLPRGTHVLARQNEAQDAKWRRRRWLPPSRRAAAAQRGARAPESPFLFPLEISSTIAAVGKTNLGATSRSARRRRIGASDHSEKKPWSVDVRRRQALRASDRTRRQKNGFEQRILHLPRPLYAHPTHTELAAAQCPRRMLSTNNVSDCVCVCAVLLPPCVAQCASCSRLRCRR